jgi:putative tryptophan/tyrosine transport system substrate-binding protein
MRRREFLGVLCAATVWHFAAHAQPDGTRRVGVLMGIAPSDPEFHRRIQSLTEALRDLGWIEGTNVVLEIRSAGGNLDRAPALAAELVDKKVDVIVTAGTQMIEASRKATTRIPIVMAVVGNAVGAGFVTSLARPGGNLTGLTLVATEQTPKRLELLKEVLPDVTRVSVLWNSTNSAHHLQWKELERAAPSFAVQLQSLPVRDRAELETAVLGAAQGRAQALLTLDDQLIISHRHWISASAVTQRLPLVGEVGLLARAGGLLSYAPSSVEMFRRSASYVDKILKGANPGDLPVEQPTTFELLINLKTAHALGLTIPPAVLARADEVIE